jgi:DNA-binding NarL/FixJ family response regulator
VIPHSPGVVRASTEDSSAACLRRGTRRGSIRVVETSLRVVLVDDASLVRAGIARLLADEGIQVISQLPDATELLAKVKADRPDAVIIDVRMPPTHTTEGLWASLQLKKELPDVGVLVLSQHIETRHAVELLAGGHRGVGYLLKERIARPAELVDAVRRVAEGGTAIDPEVVRTVLETPRRSDPVAGLTAREREVLSFVAEGFSNDRIAERLALTARTVETHTSRIFTKLGLEADPATHRRVLAVLAHLRATASPSH